MEHLSTLDAGFLEAEDSDPHVSLAIGALAVLQGPLDYDALMPVLAERIGAMPRFTQMLRTWPLDLSAPEWVDDHHFDLSHHIRRAALPRPGDDRELFRFVADVMERRLDRHQPLWECWIIEGLPDGQWALLTKIHHCMADGIAATHLLGQLCDDPADTWATNIRAARQCARGLRFPKLTVNPLYWINGAWHTSVAATRAATQAVHGAVGLAGGLLRPAQASSLTGPVTSMRRYATAQVPLDDVTAVCDAFDVTLNDVALAAITDGFRTVLMGRGERPTPNSLRTLVPVSMRSNDAAHKTDNRVSVMLPYLPVEEPDPVERLRLVHRRLTKAKGSGQRQAGNVFVSAANALPFALTAWTVRMLTRLPQRGVVTLATNVPGPRQRLRIMGRDVVRLMPIPPIALQLRTGVAILSYADQLTFGIIADYDATPDVDDLARGIERAVSRLLAASRVSRRCTDGSILSVVPL
ncbi:WS/DGAT/MGAT family O-acyltransferase [Mycolicibacterium pulveris]|uniref:WS/DGAT/MGAT family O-acyltransferase n=1 Tax=Mycolicibacterium pulveris TaxID=36813 RepID=UPI003CED30EC